MSLRADFEARFPDMFDTGTLDRWFPLFENTYNCYISCYITLDYNNTCDKEAALLLLAHLIYLSMDAYKRGGESKKDLASITVASVSQSFISNPYVPQKQSELWEWLKSSAYGLNLYQLLYCGLNTPRAISV